MSLSFIPGRELMTGEPLFVMIDGLPVPFFIESFDIKSEETAFVKFDDINSIDKASRLVKCEVYIEEPSCLKQCKESDSLKNLDLEGFYVKDKSFGPAGEVKDVIDMHGHTVMVLNYWGKEIMVPLHDDFIVSVDEDEKVVVIDTPDGLFDV